MVTLQQLKNDNRFYVDDFNLNRIIKAHKYLFYTITTIEIGKILRLKDDGSEEIVPLSETLVYKYLIGKETDYSYKEYCKSHLTPYRSLDYFKNLINVIKEEGYNIQKGAIFIDQHSIIVEGQHRCCILLKEFGPEYKIPVVRLYIIQKPNIRFLYKWFKAYAKINFFK